MFHAYGVMIGIAIVAGWTIAEREDKRVGKALPFVTIFGFLGARIYHVIDLWEYYQTNFLKMFEFWNGGLGIWGGIVGGLVGFWLASKIYRFVDKQKILIAGIVGLPLAQAIGRLGNAVNGEFLEKVGVIPWWAGEMLLDILLFGVVFAVNKKIFIRKERVIGVYLIGYGLIRFCLEFWRVNNWEVGGLGVAQWLSILSVVIGLLICQVSARD